MPRDYHDDLIRLYAGNLAASLPNVAAFQQLCTEFAQDASFLAERHRVELAKTKLETVLERQMPPQQVVQKAIQFLIQTRGNNQQRDLCHELIVAGYRPRWTEARQRYFDDAWKMIKLEYDYFLSFTSRYPPGVAGDNPINTAYQQFIISEIGVDEYNKADRKKQNLLASAVQRLLSQPRMKGFYFPHTQYDNTVTEKKLEEACDNSLVFVQLVQTIMFDPPATGTNFCFFEWNRVQTQFAEADKDRRILFVVAAQDRNVFLGVLPFYEYDLWHDHIRRKDPPYLPEVQFYSEATLREVKRTFQDKMVPEIRAAWFRLIEGAP